MSKPWEKFPEIWKTESAWLTYVRGGIRRGLWKNYPPKLEFLKSRAELKENTNPRSQKRFPFVKMWCCEQCNKWFSSKDIQVDHKEGNHSLKSIDEIGSYVEAMLLDCAFEDYAILCTSCHKIKTYAESKNISLEKALIEKKAIEIVNSKKDKEFIKNNGLIPASNQSQRRKQVEEILNASSNST